MSITYVACRSRTVVFLVVAALFCGLFLMHGNAQSQVGANSQAAKHIANSQKGWTISFPFERDFLSRGKNPYFNLEPGSVYVLESKEKGRKISLTITVLDEVELVDGVETRVVEERETQDGVLAEVSRNFIAISKNTNGVFYFGEDSTDYKDGKVAGHGGSWKAGVNGAKAGLLVPGTILLGARFHQEIAPGVAMDRSEIISMDETVTTPAGTFPHCVIMQDSSPDEPHVHETKAYAPGIGLIRDESLQLVKFDLR